MYWPKPPSPVTRDYRALTAVAAQAPIAAG